MSSNVLETLQHLKTRLEDEDEQPNDRVTFEHQQQEAVSSPFEKVRSSTIDTDIVNVHQNTNQKLIIITEDKALLCLRRNIALLGKNEWIAPLSLVLAILIALITSDFRTALWLNPAEWKAMFVISGFLSTGWLALSLRRATNVKNAQGVVYDIVKELGGRKQTPEHLELE